MPLDPREMKAVAPLDPYGGLALPVPLFNLDLVKHAAGMALHTYDGGQTLSFLCFQL